MAQIKEYYLGEPVRLKAAFSNTAGAATDPTAITLKVQDPADVETIYTFPTEVVRDSAGNYHYDVVTTMSGRWFYRWIGSGAVSDVGEMEFYVRPSEFAS